jgi:hypothetical protein
VSGPDLSGYVDVAERLRAFFARYPDGSIQSTPPTVIELDGKRFLQVTATAYRTPTDARPAVATAWEPWPGRTPYTRDSEAMNCETSAIGRALAALGLEVRRVASADEVRARRDDVEPMRPTAAQKKRLARLLDAVGLDKDQALTVARSHTGRDIASAADLDRDEASALIAALAKVEAGAAHLEPDDDGLARIVDGPPPEDDDSLRAPGAIDPATEELR